MSVHVSFALNLTVCASLILKHMLSVVVCKSVCTLLLPACLAPLRAIHLSISYPQFTPLSLLGAHGLFQTAPEATYPMYLLSMYIRSLGESDATHHSYHQFYLNLSILHLLQLLAHRSLLLFDGNLTPFAISTPFDISLVRVQRLSLSQRSSEFESNTCSVRECSYHDWEDTLRYVVIVNLFFEWVVPIYSWLTFRTHPHGVLSCLFTTSSPIFAPLCPPCLFHSPSGQICSVFAYMYGRRTQRFNP